MREWSLVVAASAMTLVAIDACSTTSPGSPDGGLEAGAPDVASDGDAAPCVGAPQTDPNNCGKCGHSCLGGDCAAGQCQPAVIATAKAPTAVALDATNVYWTEAATAYLPTGSIWKLALAGGAPVQLASKQLNPYALAVDSTNVYWANNLLPGGSVSTVPIAGGAVTQLVTDADCISVTLTDAEVIWSQEPGGTLRMPKAGGNATLIYNGSTSALVTDGTNLYWTATLSPTGAVERSDLVGDAGTTVLASGQDFPLGIALRAGTLYWANLGVAADAGSVATLSVDGGTPSILASGPGRFSPVAVDDADVYFSDIGSQQADDGAVLRVSQAGGPVTVLAAKQGAPVAIAVDATAVYWANKLDGTIMRLAK